MKPNYNIRRQKSTYVIVLGFLAFIAASCGSYQNTSYYDRDGIYGGSESPSNTVTSSDNSATQGNQYKDYFGSLQNDPEIITDVDNYSTPMDTTATAEYASYGGWGSGSENVTVNVYGGNWGYGLWNNYWYGPSWGWGWGWYDPYWSWGWGSWYGPNWGWGWNAWYPYYGYGWYGNHWGHWHNNYAYSGGRRGYYNSAGGSVISGRNYSSGRRSFTQYNSGRRNSSFSNSGTRTYSTSTAPRSNPNVRSGTRTYTPQSSGVRQSTSSSPSRSYSPSSSGGSRSYGGGGGGSRGSSGGRR
jgi:hypothetical protein